MTLVYIILVCHTRKKHMWVHLVREATVDVWDENIVFGSSF